MPIWQVALGVLLLLWAVSLVVAGVPAWVLAIAAFVVGVLCLVNR